LQLGTWYELRVEGSAGTRTGNTIGTAEGIAIANNGRLCSIDSGQAKRFASEQEAMQHLSKTNIPGNYCLEIVACAAAEALRKASGIR
jgi:hypothetical protein